MLLYSAFELLISSRSSGLEVKASHKVFGCNSSWSRNSSHGFDSSVSQLNYHIKILLISFMISEIKEQSNESDNVNIAPSNMQVIQELPG